jgi:hypothetical protein
MTLAKYFIQNEQRRKRRTEFFPEKKKKKKGNFLYPVLLFFSFKPFRSRSESYVI